MRKKAVSTIYFPINIKHLDYFIIYVRSNSPLITSGKLVKLQELISNLDPEIYESDMELDNRVRYLGHLIDYRLSHKKVPDDAYVQILSTTYSYGEYLDDINEEVLSNLEVPDWDDGWSDDDILMIEGIFNSILRYSFLYNSIDKFDELSLEFKSESYDSINEITDKYQNLVSNLYINFRETENQDKDSLNDFNSNDIESLTRTVDNTKKQAESPISKIKTSIRMKNEMLNGGFESGRCYLVLGLQGGGKSGELLRIALDAKKLVKPEDIEDGRIPVILFVSQENSIRETFERIWSYYMSNTEDLKKYSIKEIIDILNKNGFTEGSELHIKYRKSKSISTQDIDNMIENIEATNEKKVIMVIHDYLKRIRSTKNLPNLYEELGEASDEFCNIAKSRNIPIVSAMQFNREAMKKIENAVSSKKNDALKSLSSSDVGESVKIIDNCDVIYSIYTQPDNEREGCYLQSFKLLKYRGLRGEKLRDYFLHPFVENNGIKLEPDINLPVGLSRINENSALDNINASSIRTTKHIDKSEKNFVSSSTSEGKPLKLSKVNKLSGLKKINSSKSKKDEIEEEETEE